MEILKADINDSAEILALQRIAYQQEAEMYNVCEFPPLTQTRAELDLEFKNGVVLKDVIKNIIIGSVRAYVKSNNCYISRLIVHPEYQNQGIGTKLMNNIEKYFADKKVEKYELSTIEKSKKNIYLYKKLGYKIFKTEKMNDKVTIVYLEKIL